MNNNQSNWQRIHLDNYLEKIRKGKLKGSSFEATGFELLRLLFAYRRSQYGLHLRWHKAESIKLAWLTVQDLKSRKNTDPVLNGIYDALVIHGNGNEELVKKLLETAEGRLDEISSSQANKASTLRELNPLLQRAEIHRKRNKGISTGEIIERLKDDVGSHGIVDYGDDMFVYEDPIGSGKEKSMRTNSVRNAIRGLKNGTRKYRDAS